MIACPACGYPNGDEEYRCERCGRRFDMQQAQTPAEPALAVADESVRSEEPPEATLAGVTAATAAPPENAWRDELSSRVQRYRRRRFAQGILPLDFAPTPPQARPAPAKPATRPDLSRKVIPFEEIAAARAYTPETVAAAPAPVEIPERAPWPAPGPVFAAPAGPPAEARRTRVPRARLKPTETEQPSFAFPEALSAPPLEMIECEVAPLAARLIAGAADAAVLAAGYGAFFAAYTLTGGKFPLQRGSLTALAAAIVLVAFVYVFLFLYYGAATPGMHWLGLRLVDFDGNPARRDQRLLRLVGIAASGAAMGFGFLWALVDEDALAWHDRISRTCLTFNETQ